MKKEECIEIFNAMIRGTPISFTDKIIPLISKYLTENNIENSDKLIKLMIDNPDLVELALPKITSFFRQKYNIYSLMFNNKTILYYGSNTNCKKR